MPDSGSRDVAQSDAEPAGALATTETATTAGAPEGPGCPPDTVGGGGTGLSTGPGRSSEQCASAGPDLPLPGMGFSPKEAGCLTETPHHLEEDGPEHPGTSGDVHRTDVGAGFPCSASVRRDHAVATAAESSGRQGVLADGSSLRLQHLGPHGGQPEGTQSSPIQPGQSTEQKLSAETWQGQKQREIEPGPADQLTADRAFDREALLEFIAHARLINTGNWCFANSATYSLLWSTLTISDFTRHVWGVHCNTLHDFVPKFQGFSGDLTNEPWFNQILQCWGRAGPDQLGQISQQDAAEFVSSWLEIMQSSAFDMRWGRRLEAEGTVHKVDESADSLPLFLQFAPIHTHLPRCALSDLIQVWHLADGMKAALLSASTCICVHIARCIRDPRTSKVSKRNTVIDTEVDCLVPMFTADTLRCGLVEYTIVAIQAHLGGDAHGHYRTALRIQPTVTQGPSPSTWLITDDGQAPAPVWSLPNWLQRNATVMWLVRSDGMTLPQYADPIAANRDRASVEVMLSLLKPLDQDRLILHAPSLWLIDHCPGHAPWHPQGVPRAGRVSAPL